MSVEIQVSNKLLGRIDNLVLQKVLALTKKIPVNKIKRLHLKVTDDNKQRIELKKGILSKTMFCEKPIDAEIIVYQRDENTKVYCLADEIPI